MGRFVGGDDFVRQFAGHVIVVRKLHGVAGAALRHGGEVRGIRKHFRERHHGFDDDVMAACFAAFDAAPARAEVAHQIAGILIRRVDLHVHDRFEERRPSLLHGLLERKRAGDSERHVRGIDVVILAVIEGGAEIGHRETGEIAARGGFADAAFDGGNPVVRNRAAENVVNELNALVAFGGLELDAAHTELAVPAGLFLVLAFGVCLAADGFTIGNLWRLEREIDVVALLKLGHNNLNVLLAVSGEQEFLGLRIAGETQCRVFFHHFVNGDADFIFIGAGFGVDRESDGRLRQLRGLIVNGSAFVANGIAGNGFLQFGDGADIARVKLLNFRELFPLNHHGVLKTFRNIAIEIEKRGVVFKDTALDLEIVDAAGEGIGKSLENEEGKRLRVIVLAVDAIALAGGFLEAGLRVLVRMRER